MRILFYHIDGAKKYCHSFHCYFDSNYSSKGISCGITLLLNFFSDSYMYSLPAHLLSFNLSIYPKGGVVQTLL